MKNLNWIKSLRRKFLRNKTEIMEQELFDLLCGNHTLSKEQVVENLYMLLSAFGIGKSVNDFEKIAHITERVHKELESRKS